MSAERRRIRALTIIQPWAHLIAHGAKRVENRTWEPTARGLAVGDYLAVHAGLSVDLACWDGAHETMPREEAPELRALVDGVVFTTPERARREFIRGRVPLGAVVAVARLAAVEDEEPADDAYWCGPWGWRLDEVIAIDPVPCKGAQGLWELPPDVYATVRERWAARRVEVPRG